MAVTGRVDVPFMCMYTAWEVLWQHPMGKMTGSLGNTLESWQTGSLIINGLLDYYYYAGFI